MRHAIRATFSETRRAYIHPATHYASDRCNPNLPPMGLRLRLSSAYFHDNLARFPAGSQSRVIFKALYHYGIINADNGGSGLQLVHHRRPLQPLEGRRPQSAQVACPGSAFVVVKSQAQSRRRGGRC